MKILMVNKFLCLRGGSETYIYKLGKYMESLGHKVQYFGMEHENRCMGNSVDSYTNNMDLHSRFTLNKWIYPIKIIYSSEARKKLRLVLDDFQPDVCHLNNFNFQLTPSIILEIIRWRKQVGKRCKIIYTAHDYQLVCPAHLLYNVRTGKICEDCLGGHFGNCAKERCIHGSFAKSLGGMMEAIFWNQNGVYRYIDRIICPSNFLKSKLDTNSLFAEKTIVMHNFVDQIEWKEIKKKAYVLYFGRYSEEKGIRTLIQVCKELHDIQFVFAGSGPLECILDDVVNIKNVGFQEGKALRTLIGESLFSICPSECYENCPFSVIESQMYGTPVLGANVGGIPELIQEGKTGELFISGNKDELKRKILNLWTDRKKLEYYHKNCRIARFETIDDYTRKLIQIYLE